MTREQVQEALVAMAGLAAWGGLGETSERRTNKRAMQQICVCKTYSDQRGLKNLASGFKGG